MRCRNHISRDDFELPSDPSLQWTAQLSQRQRTVDFARVGVTYRVLSLLYDVADTTTSGEVHSLMYCAPVLLSVQVGTNVRVENWLVVLPSFAWIVILACDLTCFLLFSSPHPLPLLLPFYHRWNGRLDK